MQILGHLLLAGAASAAVQRLSSTPTSSGSTSTTNPPMTLMVWSTNAAGSAAQVRFTQSFSQLWSTLNTPKAGSIGLGSIQGTIGTSRELAQPAATTLALVPS